MKTGCEIKNCASYKENLCHYEGSLCKYRLSDEQDYTKGYHDGYIEGQLIANKIIVDFMNKQIQSVIIQNKEDGTCLV